MVISIFITQVCTLVLYGTSHIYVYHTFRNHTFKRSDAFIGFQKDTPASVLFYATNQLKLACVSIMKSDPCSGGHVKWNNALKNSNFDITQFGTEGLNSEAGKAAVSYLEKR